MQDPGFATGANAIPTASSAASSSSSVFLRTDPKPACKKCGYQGHLTFQCRNFIQLDPAKEVVLDVSSTSSDTDNEYATPLTELRSSELKDKLKKAKKKSEKKKKKKRKRKHSTSSSDESESSSERKRRKKEKKAKREKKAKKEKRKKKRRHSSSSSSSSD